VGSPSRGRERRFHSWYTGERAQAAAEALHPDPTHANWFENFPWTRLAGVALPSETKPMAAIDEMGDDPADVRRALGDGTFGGSYERPDDEMLRLWEVAVAEVRDLLDTGW
jgi:creatinine amidohydrolase